MTPAAAELERFAADLDALLAPGARLGVAVSGGPDSLALLLLAAAARPRLVEAASVDHALRAGSADEAGMVADLCAKLNVPHRTLTLHWSRQPESNLQARARDARYEALGGWAKDRGLPAIATAHHADDQAETLLMRLARGAGLGGLAGARASRRLDNGVEVIRPLLGWRKAELARLVDASGLSAVDDPSNRDPRHDRSRFRVLLAGSDWADPVRLAASAAWLAEADDALDWAAKREAVSRVAADRAGLSIDASELPHDLQRRLLLIGFDQLGAEPPRGPDLARALDALRQGRTVTLGGLKLKGGQRWRLSVAPPRR